MMRFYWIAVLFALLAVPAYAQQPQQPSTVQQLMASDLQIKLTLAEQLDKANAQIAALKAENEAAKAEVKRLADKYETKKEFGKDTPDATKAK